MVSAAHASELELAHFTHAYTKLGLTCTYSAPKNRPATPDRSPRRRRSDRGPARCSAVTNYSQVVTNYSLTPKQGYYTKFSAFVQMAIF